MSDEDTTNSQPESEQVLENDNEEDQKELLKGDAIGETLFRFLLYSFFNFYNHLNKFGISFLKHSLASRGY